MTLFLNLIPIIDIKENTISIFKGWGFRAGENGFSMRVLVYVFEVGFFLCGSWCGSWFHHVGLGLGLSVG